MGTALHQSRRIIRLAAAGTTVLVLALGAATGARADEDEPKAPYIRFETSFELQNDWNFRSEDPANKHNQLFTTIEPDLTIGIWRGLSLNAHAVFEPVTDPDAGESRLFADQGLYLQTLILQYEGTVFRSDARSVGYRVWGGKFGPAFGIAWDEAPGIYGTDFAEDYEITERVGFGVSAILDDSKLGRHSLSFATFFADTSVLSESLIKNRGRLRLSDGGPSNTGRLNSFFVGLDGERPFGFKGVVYRIGFISQAVTGADRENGVALTFKYVWKAGDWAVTPLIEYVHFWNVEGASDTQRDYLTTSLLFEYRKWNFSVSNTIRTTRVKDGGTGRDNLFTVSGGYTLPYDIGINLAYSFRNEDSNGTHTIGVLLTYGFSFTRSLRRK